MRTLRSLITLAGERRSVKACWSTQEPERLQAYPEKRTQAHARGGGTPDGSRGRDRLNQLL